MNMPINEVGSTAFIVAHFRIIESQRAQPLFADPYAEWFVPAEMRAQAEHVAAILPEVVDMLRYRTRMFNDLAARAIAANCKQIVVLGCGFDMRSSILAVDGVKFFDVDQPAVLQYKHEMLRKNGMQPCASVACNYLDVDLPRELAKVGFDAGAPSMLIWEGNTMYLPRARIGGFLAQLCAQLHAFRIGFDYISPKVVRRETSVDGVNRLGEFFADKLGAPWVTGFDDIGELCADAPLKVVESGSMESNSARYAPEDAANFEKFAGLYSYALLEKKN